MMEDQSCAEISFKKLSRSIWGTNQGGSNENSLNNWPQTDRSDNKSHLEVNLSASKSAPVSAASKWEEIEINKSQVVVQSELIK